MPANVLVNALAAELCFPSMLRDGYALFERAFGSEELRSWRAAAVRGRAGLRHCELPDTLIRDVEERLSPLAHEIIGGAARLVRVLLFDKTAEANWGVPWHQDRSIAVRERFDLAGHCCWTKRAGYWQVEPPVEALQSMITLRAHLEDCGEDNGPLQLIPGSHAAGRLTQTEILTRSKMANAVTCYARAGDVLAIRPLLIHSSRPARCPTRRRVLHLEFAAYELARPLQWALQ